MSEVAKVIEIIDSDEDDDSESNANDEANLKSLLDLNPPPTTNKAIESNESPTPETVNQNENSKTSSETPATPPVASVSSTHSRCHRSRKSIHQHMRASPEMQFETIALDDDEEEGAASIGTTKNASTDDGDMSVASAQFNPKVFKTMPKILASKSSPIDEKLDIAFNELFKTEDVIAKMHQIAEERVRVNFLLAANGMPEINFSLYTQPDRLRFQLEDRLKQRKMRKETSARTEPQAPKKRYSLIPSISK